MPHAASARGRLDMCAQLSQRICRGCSPDARICNDRGGDNGSSIRRHNQLGSPHAPTEASEACSRPCHSICKKRPIRPAQTFSNLRCFLTSREQCLGRRDDIPGEADLSPKTDREVRQIEFPPAVKTMGRRAGIGVVVVVPTVATGRQREEPVVTTVLSRLVVAITKQVRSTS